MVKWFFSGAHTLNTDVNVILLVASVGLPSVVVGLRERIEGLEILDICGHEIDVSALPVVRRVVWVGVAVERRECVRRWSSVGCRWGVGRSVAVATRAPNSAPSPPP